MFRSHAAKPYGKSYHEPAPIPGSLARRRFLTLLAFFASVSVAGITGCRRVTSSEAAAPSTDPNTVTLYSSVDADLLEPLITKLAQTTGISIKTVGDTEATKSTGLLTRIITESQQPQADVFWSSEPLGLAELANRGLLVPGLAVPNPRWPTNLVGENSTWIGFAIRLRQIVHTTNGPGGRLIGRKPPATLEDLTNPSWQGRIGIARPQFGTTRGHMAWLLMLWGPQRFEHWLKKLAENGARLLDGNSMVVRSIGTGLIDVGLTDSDDVLGGIAEGWAVQGVSAPAAVDGQPENGCLAVPNAIGLIANRPFTPATQILLAWVLSGIAEEAMAASLGANIPVRDFKGGRQTAGDAPPVSSSAVAIPAGLVFPDWRQVHQHAESAISLCERHLRG